MTTVVEEIASILGEAYGRPYTEAEALEILRLTAHRIAAEQERKSKPARTRTRFTPELLAEANKLHNEQMLSIRQVSERLGCDRKALKAQMVEANYEVRGQKASQEKRRLWEKVQRGAAVMDSLTGNDVKGWDAHQLFRNGK